MLEANAARAHVVVDPVDSTIGHKASAEMPIA